ncbi:MAG TPA: CDP-diacylglycerol--serine O-phosphatidyltransferase [Verrucomicrobiae bacterium]
MAGVIETGGPGEKLKIYFLPNLMTAGNLFCGFLALTRIVEANLDAPSPEYTSIRHALIFILLACIFDLLDGRLARMGGEESPFGREFDSLADVVSFGVAPAFLVHRVVMKDVFTGHTEIGWFIASVYVICGALRLARFNCMAAMNIKSSSSDFLGFPIPAAAGMVASVTLFILWWDEKEMARGNWRFALPALMVFLSLMMVSEVRYPSFKKLDFRQTKPFTKLVIAAMFFGLVLILWKKVLPIALPTFFTLYLIYGFIRPRISRKVRAEIEDEDEEEEATQP